MSNTLIIAASNGPLSTSHAQERATGISPASMQSMRGGDGLRAAERAFTTAASNTLRLALPAPPEQSPASAALNAQPLDMASGIVAQMEAGVALKANLAVYRVANDMYRRLLRATAA